MKRTWVCALALVGLACGNANKTNDDGGAASGGTTATATGGTSTGSGGGNTGGSTNVGSGGTSTGGAEATGGAGHATSSGGATGTSTAGTTGTGTGGASSMATGGTTNPGTGGRASTGTGGRASTGAGTGGGTGTGTGGGTGTGTGGGTDGGGATVVATGPTAKDPTTAAEGLPQYYISNGGDDTNTGTSPEEAWATFTNIPRNKAVAVFFEKGSQWTVTVGGTVRSGLSVSAGSVYASYGTGDELPLIELESSDEKSTAMGAVQLGGNNLIDGLRVKGDAVIGFPIGTDGNVVQNCEVDGSIEGEEFGKMQLGFSISGQHNLVVGNYVHDLSGLSGDTGNVNTSGGSEAFVMNAGNNEVAYNTAINCWVPNETLNGAEGGCLEIIGNKAGEIIENAFFHHNYCERSVGLFEACAGNFSGDGQKIQLNHAVVRNSTVSYNVAVDAMWLYLLQPVNTDFEGLIFEHNTLIHGPANTDIPQGGASAFGIAYDTDPVWTTGANPTYISCTADSDCGEQEHCLEKQGAGPICQYQWKIQPGNVTVRNNLFVVLEGADAAMMVPPPGPEDFVNNIFSPRAPMGVQAGAGAIVVSDPGLVDGYYLAPASPAVDAGSPDAMQAWLDWDGNPVPCGNAPDVGAVEYCP